MEPEAKARENIDTLLRAAGWVIQDLRDLNRGAAHGVAVREFPLKTGEADYLLFVNREPVGVVEAKSEGTTLSGVSEQSEKYLVGFPGKLPHVGDRLPFVNKGSRPPHPQSVHVGVEMAPGVLVKEAAQVLLREVELR